MIEDEALDKLSIAGQSVHHMHDFDHMEVNRLIVDFDDIHCLNYDVYELICQVWVQFGTQSSTCYACQQRLFHCVSGDFESLQKLKSFLTG